jgi:outer membrane autotransporter protein
MAGPVDLTFGATYTRHLVSTTRQIVFPGVGSTVTASYQASTLQGFAKASHTFDLSGLALTPFGSIAAVGEHTDAFTESGTGGLASAATDSTAVFTGLGVGVGKSFASGTTMGTIEANIGWRHAFAGTPVAVNTFAGGTPFTVSAAPIARDVLTLAAGINLDLAPNASLRLDYDGQIGAGVQSHAGKLTFAGSM